MDWFWSGPTWKQRVEQKLDQLLAQQEKIMIDITALTDAVAQNTTVDASIETLVTQLTAEIATLASNTTDAATQTALNGLVTQLQQNDAALAAATVANTPAAPAS